MMHKRAKKYQQKNTFHYLSPHAARLMHIGAAVLLMGIADVALRLYAAYMRGAVGVMLHLGYDIECLVAGVAILTGGVFLLDYMEKRRIRDSENK